MSLMMTYHQSISPLMCYDVFWLDNNVCAIMKQAMGRIRRQCIVTQAVKHVLTLVLASVNNSCKLIEPNELREHKENNKFDQQANLCPFVLQIIPFLYRILRNKEY